MHVNQGNPQGMRMRAAGGVGGIDLRMTLLPEKLQAMYRTRAVVGKWHCGAYSQAHLPINRGFSRHFGFLGGGEDHVTQQSYEMGMAVDLWRDRHPAHGENGTYSCNLYGREAVDIVDQHMANRDGSAATAGLFLYLAFHDTHSPYQSLPQYEDPTIVGPGAELRKTMQAMLTCVDQATGNLTAALKRHGLWAETLLVWSSDNGGPQYWAGNNHPFRGTRILAVHCCM